MESVGRKRSRPRRAFTPEFKAEIVELCGAVQYLLWRGQYSTASSLARAWYQAWRDALGPDDHHVLSDAATMAASLRELGIYSEAEAVNDDTLARRRRILGDDHPDTLALVNYSAIDMMELSEFKQARQLIEENLARCRRVLGEDHPITLALSRQLAAQSTALLGSNPDLDE